MKKSIISILVVSIITLTLFLTGCNMNSKDKLREQKLSQDKGDMIEFNLYYNSSNSENDSSVTEEKRSINKDEVLGRIILEELIKGPSTNGKLQNSLPKDTKLLSFTIKDNIGYISLDFGEEPLKMTTVKEISAIKSIIMSLKQLSSVEKIKISVPKTNQNTFGGNIDITKPVTAEDLNKLQTNK